MNDLFIRRVYTYKGISVAVDIDLIAKTISLVEKNGNSFKDKTWYFTHRELEYVNSWLLILDAMKHAITEASEVLGEAERRDAEKFTDMLMHLNKNLDES